MKKIVIDARESGTTTGRYIDKLIENLHQLKPSYKVVILTTKKRLEAVQKIARRFEVVECRYKEFGFGEQLGLWRQIHKLKPDLVHFGMVQQPILYRGKVVTTMHDLTGTRFRNPSKNWLIFTIKQQVYKWVNRIVAHKSKVIMTGSEFVKEDVAKYARVNSRKIVVTYEAADKIEEEPEPVEELKDKDFLMYTGRPQPHKNLPRLIGAFSFLRQQYPGLRLVLAGKKDTLYKQIEKDVNEHGINNVIFTGFVSEGQLRWLYENTKCYVFPSLSEGFGLPGLEAMVHGAPVASSNATCLPEVYQDGAIYFDPLDPHDIADKIEQVLTKSSLATDLVEKGRKVAAKYSWKRMAEQTLAIYNDVLRT